MTILRRALYGATLVFGFVCAGHAAAETAAQGKPSAPALTTTAAPTPVRVVSANPQTGPATCQNAVWPSVPPECLKGKEGTAQPVKQVRVVNAQDDLRTNPAAASEAGKAPKKLRRLPRQQ